MATHNSTLAWRIPWAEEPGRLQSMGSQSWTQLTRYEWKMAGELGRACERKACFIDSISHPQAVSPGVNVSR